MPSRSYFPDWHTRRYYSYKGPSETPSYDLMIVWVLVWWSYGSSMTVLLLLRTFGDTLIRLDDRMGPGLMIVWVLYDPSSFLFKSRQDIWVWLFTFSSDPYLSLFNFLTHDIRFYFWVYGIYSLGRGRGGWLDVWIGLRSQSLWIFSMIRQWLHVWHVWPTSFFQFRWLH